MPMLSMVFLLTLLTPSTAVSRPAVADQPLLLDVYVNGQNIGKIGEFVLRGPDLLATREELRALGFRVRAGLTERSTGEAVAAPTLVSIGTLAGVTYRVDSETQSVYITTPLERLLLTTLSDDDPARVAHRENPDSSRGLTMNYDASATLAGGVASAASSLDLRQYSTLGVFSSGFLLYSTGSPLGGGHLIRLDTNFTRANVGSMRRYSVGDFVSGSLSWSRPVRLEGVQVRSDFGTRPDLITFPLPSLGGSVSVPSTIQVFNETGQVISSQVAPGPFQIPQVPTVTGAGTIQMSVTSATGQQVTTRQSFYATPALLRPGLQSYSIEAGRTRLNWGLHSEDFGGIAESGTYRRGMTPSLTLEATAQNTSGGTMAGGGAVVKFGSLGVANVAAAASFGAAGMGEQLAVDVERKGRYASFEASVLTATANFRDIAALNGDGTVRSQISISGSFSARKGGSIGILYSAARRDLPGVTQLVGAPNWTRSESVAVTLSRQVRNVSLYANGYADITNNQVGLIAGFVIPLRHRTAVNVSGGYGTPAQVQVTKSAADVGDWGYQVFADASGTEHLFADVERRTQHGYVTAGVDSSAGLTTLRTTSSGSVSVVDGDVFVANRIQDSFAVVDVSGLAGVRVLDESRVVGTSDKRGRMLVPDLLSYQANHIAIDTDDVPLDVTLGETARVVRPQDHSGVVVRFSAVDSRGALVSFINAAGDAIPAGSMTRLLPGGERAPVGYEGAAYLVNLAAVNHVKVELPDGSSCFSEFKYAHLPGAISAIGPVPCR